MILQQIKDKLSEIDTHVFYGMVDPEEVKEIMWDYIVFNRTELKSSANKTGFSDYYEIHIVRENFVPEGVDLEIIEKMKQIEGMRLAGTDGTYNYVRKPNTNIVVEMLTLSFVRARK